MHDESCYPYTLNRRIMNTFRPRKMTFSNAFLKENIWMLIKISLKFVPRVRINNIPALVQIMARRRPGDKPLSEPIMVSALVHICVTRPQSVKSQNWVIWNLFGWHKLSWLNTCPMYMLFFVCLFVCLFLFCFCFHFFKSILSIGWSISSIEWRR